MDGTFGNGTKGVALAYVLVYVKRSQRAGIFTEVTDADVPSHVRL